MRHALLIGMLLLGINVARADAEPLMVFTYEGRISLAFVGLLDALAIDSSERVVFSFVVGQEDPTRTGLEYAQRDVLSSRVTIGDYSIDGKAGLTQIFNGPVGSANYDQFTAYSVMESDSFPFDGRWLVPGIAYLTLQGNVNVIESGAYPAVAPNPNAFAGHLMSLGFFWADDPQSGVAIIASVDRATTTTLSAPEPARCC